MSKSLKEQLLAAGLVSKQQASQADAEKRKQARNPQQRKGAPPPGRRAAQQAQVDKAERDREINRQRQLAAERRALAAQVDQLIEPHRINLAGGDEPYRFVYDGVIKSLYCKPEHHPGLADGSLAVVRYRRAFALVDRATAERVAERDPKAVAVLHDPSAAAAAAASAPEDDPYAAYQVPDDLKW